MGKRYKKSSAQHRELTDGAGDGNRTRVTSLEGWCSTIELHLHGLSSRKARLSYHRQKEE